MLASNRPQAREAIDLFTFRIGGEITWRRHSAALMQSYSPQVSVKCRRTHVRGNCQRPGLSTAALAASLQTSHRTMPNVVIKGDDADNIIAYILSLKARN